MLRIMVAVAALLIVSSTSSAHDIRRLSVAPHGATATLSPLVVVEVPLGTARFDVLSAIARQRIRTLGGVFGASRIVVLRTRGAVGVVPRFVRLRSRGRTLFVRRR